MTSRALFASLLLVALGCAEDHTTESDAGSGVDAGVATDAGSGVDTGVATDAGPRDAGITTPDACEEITDEVACIANTECTPTYDDTCCSSCDPGPCADCYAPRFHTCVSARYCDGTTPYTGCSQLDMDICTFGQARCADDFPWDEEYCGTPGCVVAVPSECPAGGCEPFCVPLREGVCGPATCRSPAPECPAGMVPEIEDSFCYTGNCIAARFCGG